ncbi:ketosteroid isomerase-like protein [Paraburkholderia sp. WSM4175]|uniref:nuclear transport factor 2 family protein n=1 Tax=Paraburkholderia sp. WSM4175 TaxID=2991072 RepID=UPI003D2597FD
MTATVTDISTLVHEFWTLMGSNDFASVESVLSEQFILEWPQSNERIRGAARFAQMNSEYPAEGPWRFTVNRVVANTGHEAVSDVTVTDGALTARAISFFSAEAGKITKIVEYWPEPYAAPVNRAHLVELIDEKSPY